MGKDKSHSSILFKLIKVFAIVWVLSIIIFGGVIFFATKGLTGTVQTTQFGNSNLFLVLMLGSMGIGGLAFGLLILSVLVKIIFERKVLKFERSFKGIVVFWIKIFFLLAILPLFLLFKIVKPLKLIELIRSKKLKIKFTKQLLREFAFIFLIIIFLFPIWGLTYFIGLYIPANMAGLISQPISIAGTGSMYPTFPKGHFKDPKEMAKELVATPGMKRYPNGIRVFNFNIFGHEIERGDIIVFDNKRVKEINKKSGLPLAGFVKRVIGLPGDELMIKDGLVYLNEEVLKEPYIAKARSTFGGEFLSDCKKIKIPKNKLFVMGDNRKASDDSRIEVGFVDYNDVEYVLPFKDQLGKLDKGWHDPKNDDKELARIILDKNKYLELLNSKRKEEGVKPLTYQSKLEKSSLLRGEVILKYDDFSYDATRSGYTQVRAMNDAGYSNIVWNEGIVPGSYDAEELIEYLFEFPDWKKNLLQGKDYQDFGIAEVQGILNGCPAQVIVQHLAGYVPPNYKEEDIQGWGKLISNLNDIIPGWEKIKDYPGVNKDDLNKLLGLMYRRKNNAEAIYYRMKTNQWLTTEENKILQEDKSLYDQSNALADKLNGK